VSEHFDLITIGGGSAARAAAYKAKDEFGARVALVESTRWGGDCPNVACRPTKAYLVAADLAHDIRTHAHRLGIDVDEPRVELRRIREWKDSLRSTQDQWRKRLRTAGFSIFEGVASFVDPRTLRVGEYELSADRILIATGSRTAVPPVEGIEEAGFVDHVTALDLDELPESLLVLGAGPVGLEFAQAFSRYGSRVTVLDIVDRISPRSDGAAAAELADTLAGESIDLVTGTIAKRVRRERNELVATLAPREGGNEREIRVAQILVSAGRRPNVEQLQLERAGIHYERTHVPVDEHMRTNVEGIWAAGDVATQLQFTPIAQYQGRLAVLDMFTDDAPAADYSAIPTAIYTDPELGAVGLAEHEAREQGFEVGTATYPLKDVTRAQYYAAQHGLYKLVFERGSGRVLGIHVVCRGASDIVQGLAVAMRLGLTVDDLARMHHAYPSFGEGVKAAAERALAAVASG
jgi:pyruvate/2-oxoglutarate dehydrogenase complex dihydrolipoamide dehydrogenase (E3) component